jgi:hypothetical protein
MRERELVAWIRQARGVLRRADGPAKRAAALPQDQLQALETRIAHLEALLVGLQDSVHRESARQAKRIAELEARTQPGAIGRALSDDARARGL